VRILANNSTNPELLASAAATITRALQHHTFDAPPTALLKGGLLPALASGIESLPPPSSCQALDGTSIATVDCIAAVFTTLLEPSNQRWEHEYLDGGFRTPPQVGSNLSAFEPWQAAFACLSRPTVARYLLSAAFCDSKAGSGPASTAAADSIDGDRNKRQPGTDALLLIGAVQCSPYAESQYSVLQNMRYTGEPCVMKHLLAVCEQEVQAGRPPFNSTAPQQGSAWLQPQHASMMMLRLRDGHT
jgi:hypothetical protein